MVMTSVFIPPLTLLNRPQGSQRPNEYKLQQHRKYFVAGAFCGHSCCICQRGTGTKTGDPRPPAKTLLTTKDRVTIPGTTRLSPLGSGEVDNSELWNSK